MRPRLTGLWHHTDFVKLWIAQTASVFGSQITLLALPLTAAITLRATPAQMGLLAAVRYMPHLLIGLFAGVWTDRVRRRPLMIVADVGRGILLALIPLAAVTDVLRIEHLYVIAFLVGILTVLFDVAYQSYLPSLVQRDHLLEGNSKLEMSRSAAEVAGPGLAGGMTQLVTAPVTIALDSLSFFVSALFLRSIDGPEPAPAQPRGRGSIWSDIGEGLRAVVSDPLLRSIAVATGISNFFSNVLYAVYILYLTRELHMAPGLVGIIFALGSIGFLPGAILAARSSQRYGLGPTIVGAAILVSVGSMLIPLADGPLTVAVPLLVLAELSISLALPVYNVNIISLRQAVTPDRLLGRVNASTRFIVTGAMPLGSLVGGALGELTTIRVALLTGALGTSLAVLSLLISPIRTLRQQPELVEANANVSEQ